MRTWRKFSKPGENFPKTFGNPVIKYSTKKEQKIL